MFCLLEYFNKSYFSKNKESPFGGVGKDTHIYSLIPGQVKLTHNYGPRASKTAGRDEQASGVPVASVSLLPPLC